MAYLNTFDALRAAQYNEQMKDPESLLKDLAGSRFYDLAKNDSSWLVNPGDDVSSIIKKYESIINMINGYKKMLSDEQYAEGDIGRTVKQQIAAGINPDLVGVAGGNGFVSGSNPAAGLIHQNQESDDVFRPFREGFNVIGSAFGFAKDLASAVGSISGVNLSNAETLFDLISKGKGLYDDVRERFRGSEDVDLHDYVMETLFGSDGSNGLLSGALPAGKLRRVREAMDSYGRGVQSGTLDKISDNQSEFGLSESQRSKRTSAHEDAVEAASGLFETEGELFNIQVQGMKDQAVNQLKITRLQQELALLTGKYDLKRVSLLDPSLAAMAQNEQQRAAISEAGYNADFFDTRDGQLAGANENAQDYYWTDYWNNKDGMTDAQRENRIAEIQKELTELNFQADRIVLGSEIKALSYLDNHGAALFDITRQQNKVDRAHKVRSGRDYHDSASETLKSGASGFSRFLGTLIRK